MPKSAFPTGPELPHSGGLLAQRDVLGAIWAGPGKDDRDRDQGSDGQTGVATKTRTKTKKPSLYRVLLLNDDYTPMEFVILILEEVFNKSREDATRIMLSVHNQGVGECGVYPYEVAETKVTNVMDAARRNQHPLQCVMEKQ
ncbi:ATP-dependent Clp protease adaptor protein ClpS [Pelagibacterium halotolerans]|uniref:ATP-dependent Clp protease adapter protein ClpS n=1 Tax=Pelagibacterium halotolerans (strain DSM 22347 / JCM 15775 / CGMCC 1.7692 / B2) TaxID=1082931 RepID=G4RBY8_PELHB|nr:ATP-dependent Clp protease adaptor protein ClpS [Pelagibacterium halotolerans B2]SEA18779.1 ATP-dependent Clp protease adaptor protein ClpS [Pelagibacterium halotolerans]